MILFVYQNLYTIPEIVVEIEFIKCLKVNKRLKFKGIMIDVNCFKYAISFEVAVKENYNLKLLI